MPIVINATTAESVNRDLYEVMIFCSRRTGYVKVKIPNVTVHYYSANMNCVLIWQKSAWKHWRLMASH